MTAKISFHWYVGQQLASQLPYSKKGRASNPEVCEWPKVLPTTISSFFIGCSLGLSNKLVAEEILTESATPQPWRTTYSGIIRDFARREHGITLDTATFENIFPELTPNSHRELLLTFEECTSAIGQRVLLGLIYAVISPEMALSMLEAWITQEQGWITAGRGFMDSIGLRVTGLGSVTSVQEAFELAQSLYEAWQPRRDSIASNESRLSLMGFLGMMGPMQQVIETRLLGRRYIRFSNILQVSAYLYETGALLGRAKREKLMILEKLLGKPQKEGDLIRYLQQLAQQRLEKFGEEPTSFYIFVVSTELDKLGLSLTDNLKTQKKAFEEKWPVEAAEPFIEICGVEGIGFGSCFPELTEKVWRKAYENIDMNQWAKVRAYGMTLPEEPPKVSFEEQEQTVLEMVAVYASKYYPELVDPLDLHLPEL